MTTKKAVPTDENKLEGQDFDLFAALAAVDNKNYDWFSSLTAEQQRKFVPYMLVYWTSAVKGKSDISNYYLVGTDVVANRHLFNEHIMDHPELQWKMLCASSPGIGKQYHQWIPHLNKNIGSLRSRATAKEIREYFTKIYRANDSDVINQCADEYVRQQNHQHRLALLYPDLKLDDIIALSEITTDDDIKRYETELGISD